MSEQNSDSMLGKALDNNPDSGLSHVIDAAGSISKRLLDAEQQHADQSLDMPNQQEVEVSSDILTKEQFHKVIPELAKESIQNRTPMHVLFADIDGFKSVNDTLGHLRGDQVIFDVKQICLYLTNRLMEPDTLGANTKINLISYSEGETSSSTDLASSNDEPRKPTAAHLGGDEIGIVLHTDEDGALNAVKVLKSLFTDYLNQPENKDLKSLDIDIAVGKGKLIPPEDELTDESIEHAVSKMYSDADEEMFEDKLNNLPEFSDDLKRRLRTIRLIIGQQEKGERKIRPRELDKLLEALDRQDKLEPKE